jgi:hypothetical protein
LPRIPTYQPNQVGPVESTGARFRAADNGGGIGAAIGQGLQGLGKAGADFITAQDQIQDQFDDTYARRFALDFDAATKPVMTQYSAQQGKNAIDAAMPTQEALTKLREETLAKASNPRMKRYLEERLAEPYSRYSSGIVSHSLGQQQVMAEETALSEKALAINDAAGSYANPQLAATKKAEALDAVRRVGALKGWDTKKLKAEELAATTAIHTTAFDLMRSGAKEDIDRDAAYLAAHKDEMTATAYANALGDLAEPLRKREDTADFWRAITPTADAAPAPGGTPASGAPVRQATAAEIKPALLGVFGKGTYVGDNAKHSKYTSSGKVSDHTVDRALDFVPPGGMGKYTTSQAEALITSELARRGLRIRRNANGTPQFFGPGRHAKNPGDHDDHYHVAWEVDPKATGGQGVDNERPQQFDKDQVYNRIDALAAKEKWSPEKIERVKAMGDQEIRRNEELDSRQKRAADEAAADIMLGKGSGFTSKNLIPAETWSKMSVGARASAEAAIERNLAPVAAKPNGPAAMLLNQMKTLMPQEFANQDLSKIVGQVSQAELDTFLTEQTKIKRDNGDIVKRRTEINAVVNSQSTFGGLKLNDAERASVAQMMEAQEVAAISGGKTPDRAASYRAAIGIVMMSRAVTPQGN